MFRFATCKEVTDDISPAFLFESEAVESALMTAGNSPTFVVDCFTQKIVLMVHQGETFRPMSWVRSDLTGKVIQCIQDEA